MKQLKTSLAVLALAAMSSLPAVAGTSPKATVPVEPPPEAPFVTGTLSLMYNSHFVSYGQDIWAAGNSLDDPLFNPSLELNFNLGGGWTAILGTWWDVNDNAESSIANRIQEVDVWAGLAYTMDKWKFTLLYQAWMYASQTEHIVDFKIAYNDGFLNPFLLLHGRVGIDLPGFDEGLVTQLGIGPSKTWGSLTMTVPISVAADTDGFHAGGSGFSFASAGLSFSYALTKNLSLGLGGTAYYTNDSVIPTNPDDFFVAVNAGFTIVF
jgi:hypothetical protein